MSRLCRLALPLACAMAALADDTIEVSVRVQTQDGTNLTGTTRLPASLAVKTKYGEATAETSTITTMQQTVGGWSVQTSGGATLVGQLAIESIEVTTQNGKMTIPASDIRAIVFTNPVRPNQPAGATPGPGGKPTATPKFEGWAFREAPSEERLQPRDRIEPALLLSSGKHIAVLDRPKGEVVFVGTEDGACKRVKVESEPVHVLEKGGKIYVANSKSSSISVIDAAKLEVSSRIALGAGPYWMASPATADVMYVSVEDFSNSMLSVNLKTGKAGGPMMSGKTAISGYAYYLNVTPDNALLIAQGNPDHSPSATPSVYLVNGQNLTMTSISYHKSHPGPFLIDLQGARIYAGFFVYSLDMSQKLADLTCLSIVPHPTRNLVFGTKKPPNWDPATEVVVLDEQKLTEVATIAIGAPVRALVATEDTLYAVGLTQIFPVPLAENVPREALAQPREMRIPIDFAHPPSDANVKSAEALCGEGSKAVDGGKLDVARQKFEEAFKLDPLSGAKTGLGMVLLREEKVDEAIEVLQTAKAIPYRNGANRLAACNQLGIALGKAGRSEEAILVFRGGLAVDPKHGQILANLGLQYASAGDATKAYIALKKAVEAGTKVSEAKKALDDVTKGLMEAAEVCRSCDGKGRHETVIEDDRGKRSKIIEDCKTCDKKGSYWKRPCVDCWGSGEKGYYDACDKCFGRGWFPEGAKVKK